MTTSARDRPDRGRGAVQRAFDRRQPRRAIQRIDQRRGLAGELPVGGNVRGDHRRAQRQGFDDRQVEAFRQRRAEQRRGASDQARQFTVAEVADLMHQPDHRLGALQVVDHRLVLPAAPAHQHQPRRLGAQTFGKPPPGREQEGDVLARLERADADEIGSRRRPGLRLVEERRLDPQRRHFGGGGAAAVRGGVVGQLSCRRRRVGDHQARMGDDLVDAALVARLGSGRAVFGKVDRDQVVHHDHRRYAPLGQTPQHARLVEPSVADVEVDVARSGPGRPKVQQRTGRDVEMPLGALRQLARHRTGAQRRGAIGH